MQPIEQFMAALTTLTAARVLTPLNDNQRAQLGQDLPRDVVKDLDAKKDKQGRPIQYVDGLYVIEQLNRVFGFDGWSVTYGAMVIIEGERPVIHVPVTLIAGGVTRSDIGVGVAANKGPDAMETAIKGAFTDGLKRCARTWGSTFGLALYEKDRDARAVGWSFEAQGAIRAFDGATDAASYETARAASVKVWPTLAPDERAAVKTAQERAAARVPDAAPANTTAPAAPPAPKPSPAVQLAVARIAVALSARTVVAAIMACGARGAAAVPVDEAVAARRAEGVDLGDLEATLTKARGIGGLTSDHWGAAASALADFDGATDAPSINLARKKHAAAIVALPEALRSGVKAAADARAAALGAPTVASVLLAKVREAKVSAVLKTLHAELKAAVDARRITSKADVDAVTDALNARADELAERAAMVAA